MDKRFLGILAVIIIVFIGIFAISQHSNGNSSGSSSNSKAQTTNHITGNGAKGVTLMEYGDYQCPVCEAYYLPLKQAVAQLNNDIYFQFRNLPLSPSPHPNAFAAARAAEAAGMQNKYWQMHDKLYDNQNEWANLPNPQPAFNQYAQSLGLNVNQFKQDYASTKVNDAINADLAAFDKTGQEKATPTFFVDGKYVANTNFSDTNTGPSTEKIVSFLNAEIAKKNTAASSSSQSKASSANPY
jgi:protein-disulfide isomerase